MKMKNNLVSVGKILNFHGVKGEAKLGYTKNREDFLAKLETVYILVNNEYKKYEVSNIRFTPKCAIITGVSLYFLAISPPIVTCEPSISWSTAFPISCNSPARFAVATSIPSSPAITPAKCATSIEWRSTF